MAQPDQTPFLSLSGQPNRVAIRRAGVQDVAAFGKIINDCAEYGLMLHRSPSYLYEHVRDFHVCLVDGQVAGVCGLNIVWANLAEVYALAVSPNFRGKGLGKRLVLTCIDEAEELGIKKLMTLTYEKDFFHRCGFTVVDRMSLPHKVWSECVRCPKNQACDEIAMIRELDVPDLSPAEVMEAPIARYDVPVPLIVRGQPHAVKSGE
jgi:amino-acid N-acetyltransferase